MAEWDSLGYTKLTHFNRILGWSIVFVGVCVFVRKRMLYVTFI